MLWCDWIEDRSLCLGNRYAIELDNCVTTVSMKRLQSSVEHAQRLRSAEQAAIFCPEGSKRQLRISAYASSCYVLYNQQKEHVNIQSVRQQD